MIGHVYVIGAGCGKYDLITVRGLDALKRCSTVIYDALIDPEVLSYAGENAELICVGKRAGCHSAKQDEINALLVEKALDGCTVARLKGGDPFVFGRGGEEITALKEHDIPYTVVPGISSAVAVPELSGIPVTHRRAARSFHVITAHTADGGQDFSRYAALDGTLVFLMGLNALPDIASGLIGGGKPESTPSAVISDGCTPRRREVRGTLADIAELAAKAGMTAPAVTVVGETAAYDFSCSPPPLPLTGVPVTVTGTRKFTGKLAGLLEAEGAEVHRYSHLRVVRTGDIPPLGGYECIAFTSSYGAEIFTSHCRREHIDMRSFYGVRFAAVGSGTAETLANAGIYADIVPPEFTVGALANAIVQNVPKWDKILILRAQRGSDELCRILSSHGRKFDDIKIYDTVPNSELPQTHISDGYIIFGSSSGAQSFFEGGSTITPETRVVCIGEQTAGAAKEYTDSAVITASPHTTQGAVNAVKKDVTGK